MTETLNEYMITYTFSNTQGQSGTGRTFSTGTGLIATEADVLDMDAQVKAQNPEFTTCFITNFQLLRSYEQELDQDPEKG